MGAIAELDQAGSTFDDGDEAVSPIIGAILMVAVTVILSAVVVGAFLGFKPIPSEEIQSAVNIDFEPGGDQVKVTWVDAGNAEYINVTYTSPSAGEAKATITKIGGSHLVRVGQEHVTITPNDSGRTNWTGSRFDPPGPKDKEEIDVLVTAVSGQAKRTVVTTQSGQI